MSRNIVCGWSVEALESPGGRILLSRRKRNTISEWKARTVDSLRRNSHIERSGHEDLSLCHPDSLRASKLLPFVVQKNEIQCLSGVRIPCRGHLVILIGLPFGMSHLFVRTSTLSLKSIGFENCKRNDTRICCQSSSWTTQL
jgi:hypothetical protein